MLELQQLYNRIRKYLYYLLALFVLGWGFTYYQTVFLGLILGTSLSFFNLRMLMKRTNRFGEAVAEGRKMRSFGMLTRMAIAVIGIAVVLWYPEYFHLVGFIVGLMIPYILIIFDFFVQSFRSRG